jgi:hypothetical protein
MGDVVVTEAGRGFRGCGVDAEAVARGDKPAVGPLVIRTTIVQTCNPGSDRSVATLYTPPVHLPCGLQLLQHSLSLVQPDPVGSLQVLALAPVAQQMKPVQQPLPEKGVAPGTQEPPKPTQGAAPARLVIMV